MIDWSNPDFGHLQNILAPGPAEAAPGAHVPFNAIGIGILNGAYPTRPPPGGGQAVGPVIVTQEFRWRSGPAALADVAYHDVDGNNFYSPGEGIGDVLITANGQEGEGTFQTRTWQSGGYTLTLAPGT
jgi:hypothetical protein